MEAKGEVVRGGFAGGVEFLDLIVAVADEVVVANDNAGNGGKEDGIGAEIGGEVVRGGKEVPGEGC